MYVIIPGSFILNSLQVSRSILLLIMSFELPKKFRKLCFFKKMYFITLKKTFSMKNISFMNDEL